MFAQPNILRFWGALFWQAIYNMLFYTVIGWKQSHTIISFSQNVVLVILWVMLFLTMKRMQNYVYVPVVRHTRNQTLAATFFVQEEKPKKKLQLLAVYVRIVQCLRSMR